MRVRFGTDGIRGVANTELTAELALAVGRAAARVIPTERWVLGRDTRRSGSLLASALASGLASEGCDVLDAGVLPTPAVAWISASLTVPGVVVSASHNPFADNGIKLINAGGSKLPVDTELQVEDEIDRVLAGAPGPRPLAGHGVGKVLAAENAADGYVDHLVGALEGRTLEGLHLVLDCANGAASSFAPEAFRRAGAEVDVVCAEPDGTNINDGCGSTRPEHLAEVVVTKGADLGLAFDGDADRVVAVAHDGTIASGDELLVLFARDLVARGRLAGNTVVVTVMSNLGLLRALAAEGIAVRNTPVGDRHVLDALTADGLSLGGEQSGHLVFPDLATTGDGLLTGLLLADLVVRSGSRFAELHSGAMRRVPQLLENVEVEAPGEVVSQQSVADAVAEAEAELDGRGRIVLRPSGTEPVVRVMVEADDAGVAAAVTDRLAGTVRKAAAALRAEKAAGPDQPVHSVS